jgi:hypothetical protein
LEELNALELCNSHGSFGGEGLAALLYSEHLFNLHWLDLSNCELGVEDMQALARCDAGTTLLHLNLSDNPLQPEGVAALAAWGALTHVQALDLDSTEMGDRGGRALAESPHLDLLGQLGVMFNGLSKKTKRALIDRWGEDAVECDD